MDVKTIAPNDLEKLRRDRGSIDLVDVRTPAEFREVHAVSARNIPLDALKPDELMASRNGRRNEPIYVICRSDNRGKKACERLMAAGYNNVFNVAGGTLAWADLGLPVVRGKKTISLERQVRIAAGSLVMLGAVLALLVHPWFALLSAFVGGGLVFAGMTDTCGMAMLLARMPWNQVGGEGATCSNS